MGGSQDVIVVVIVAVVVVRLAWSGRSTYMLWHLEGEVTTSSYFPPTFCQEQTYTQQSCLSLTTFA